MIFIIIFCILIVKTSKNELNNREIIYIPISKKKLIIQNKNIKPLQNNEILLIFNLNCILIDPLQTEFHAFEANKQFDFNEYEESRQKFLSGHSTKFETIMLHVKSAMAYDLWENLSIDVRNLFSNTSFMNKLKTSPISEFLKFNDKLYNELKVISKSSEFKYRIVFITDLNQEYLEQSLFNLGLKEFVEAVFIQDDDTRNKEQILRNNQNILLMIKKIYGKSTKNYMQKIRSLSCMSNKTDIKKSEKIYCFSTETNNFDEFQDVNWKFISITHFDQLITTLQSEFTDTDSLISQETENTIKGRKKHLRKTKNIEQRSSSLASNFNYEKNDKFSNLMIQQFNNNGEISLEFATSKDISFEETHSCQFSEFDIIMSDFVFLENSFETILSGLEQNNDVITN